MKRLRRKNIFYNICLACNFLLVFLALFGAQMNLPVWLQVTGRMHPLLLHFPIVLLVLAAIWETGSQGKRNSAFRSIGNALLLATALSAAITALMGLWLANEGGYEDSTLVWHKWSGTGTSLLAFLWYVFREWFRLSKIGTAAMAAVSLTAVVLTGHKGATLTHGENYLLAPLASSRQNAPLDLENALVYRDLVQPILEAKCMGCHNSRKMKGALNLETEAGFLQGGKNGVLWDSTAAHDGLMMQRIHLPVAEKGHMPPQGKPQLTQEEIRILYYWIKNGARFNQKIVELAENDSLRLLAQHHLAAPEKEAYDFDAADESTIRNLNTDFRVVHPLALHSPALAVDFYNAAAFKSEHLQELKAIREQIVHLNLNKMPVQDADLKTLATFPNLRKLNLAATQITGAAIGDLKNLKYLQQLSLSDTRVKAADLDVLHNLSGLSVLYLWNTGIAESEIPELQKSFPNVRFETGFTGKDVVAKLNAAVIEGPADVFSDSTKCRLKNYIRGAVVRYTLDGSVPDSLSSLVSNGDSITISRTTVLNTKTFLPGWTSSEVGTRTFYKAGIMPDSITLVHLPDSQYRALGPKTLINKKIGDTEYKTNKWIGYRDTDLECLMFFNRPTTLSSVYVSTLAHIGNFVMPPAEVQVWGGNDQKHLVLLKKMRPEQPTKLAKYRVGYTLEFTPRDMKVVKVILKPVARLPAWHPQKGEKGWVFMDEVFLN